MIGNPIFGDWELAPRALGALQIETPVGIPCIGCTEIVKEGDVGEIVSGNPIHRECLVLRILGHQFGVCGCTNYANQPTMRLAALEMFRRIREGIANAM